MTIYAEHALKSRTELEARISSMEQELKALKKELGNRREDDSWGWGFFAGAWCMWDSRDDAAVAYNDRYKSNDGYYRLHKIYKIK